MSLTFYATVHVGMAGQPPPLLKPSGSQAQRHPPPMQTQGGVPRSGQGGLQGPPPLIKPLVRPIQPQVRQHILILKQTRQLCVFDSLKFV